MPAESRVHRLVASNRLGGQVADVTIRLVKLQFSWQIYKGLNHYLMARARSVICGGGTWIVACCLVFQLHIQVGIGGSQFPAVHRFPIWRHFESFGVAMDSVGCEHWNHQSWRRRGLKEWSTNLKAVKIVVVVVKQRDVHVTVGRHQPSIAGFISNQFLRLELGVPVDLRVYGQARGRARITCVFKICVETRRSSNRPGDGAPQRFSRGAVPQETPARLYLETGVVVMFEFRSQG